MAETSKAVSLEKIDKALEDYHDHIERDAGRNSEDVNSLFYVLQIKGVLDYINHLKMLVGQDNIVH
jgi:hypothetical protein